MVYPNLAMIVPLYVSLALILAKKPSILSVAKCRDAFPQSGNFLVDNTSKPHTNRESLKRTHIESERERHISYWKQNRPITRARLICGTQ